MSVKYAPFKLGVPDGFKDLSEGLTKEILREQPENIIHFADKYFKDLLMRRAGGVPTVNENASGTIEDNPECGMITITSERRLSKAEEEEEAAIKIQSVMRGALARKEVNDIKTSSSTNVDDDRDENELDELNMDMGDDENAASEEELSAVAIKMQANFRGQKARKEVDELRKEEASEDVTADNAEVGDVTTTDNVLEMEVDDATDNSANDVIENTITDGDDTIQATDGGSNAEDDTETKTVDSTVADDSSANT